MKSSNLWLEILMCFVCLQHSKHVCVNTYDLLFLAIQEHNEDSQESEERAYQSAVSSPSNVVPPAKRVRLDETRED